MTTKITDKNISNLANIGVQWQSVFTGDGSTGLTTVAGRGYFINTTSGTVTVTLPASPSAGDVVVLKDYARTWGTNAVTMASALFDGDASQTPSFSTSGQTITLVYMDGTKGWSLINEDTTTGLGAQFVTATGGTVATSGDYKIHSFTGDGCFVVSCAGNPAGSTSVDYLVVGGGGGGGSGAGPNAYDAAGGGAGGYRESSGAASGCYTVSPLGACVAALPVSATTYPVTVNGGGAGTTYTGSPSVPAGTPGGNSIFSTITSAGGGGGGSRNTPTPSPTAAWGQAGASGGGAGQADTCEQSQRFGAGNTPPVSPPQGNNGGRSAYPVGSPSDSGGGGGGGAGSVGANATSGNIGGNGGSGSTSSINGTPTVRAGGGGGAGTPATGGQPGPGGGGTGSGPGQPTTAGTANTGGGGGAGSGEGNRSGGNGGSGIVIIRYKFQ